MSVDNCKRCKHRKAIYMFDYCFMWPQYKDDCNKFEDEDKADGLRRETKAQEREV